MCTAISMAASLGLGHEAYNTYFSDLMVANNCAQMSFLPPAAMAGDDYLPELGVVHPPDYYSPPRTVFTENEMNMRFVNDGRRRMVSTASGGGGNGSHRIGFRMRSEVDVLDDGFKWRKYGKKAVKSSPNPRNYYRCSVEGCGVKKRVERDRNDPRYVVTTYDGVHNHVAAAAAAAPRATPQQPAPYAVPPCNAWGTMQLQAAAATAHSSESSY